MKKRIGFLFILIWAFGSCSNSHRNLIDSTNFNREPNYSILYNWAAHPEKTDMADRIPGSNHLADQKELLVDVFFIHPTTYTGKKFSNHWNAPLTSDKLNTKTDESTILYQASIFNKAGRVYAPRYRQSHLDAFYSVDKSKSKMALEIAYRDVKSAFLYYLDHYNNGRPIIIASHSQGTYHAKILLKEFFDNTPLQSQLVAAYLVGMPVEKDYFEHIKPCDSEKATSCFCTWRTFRRNFTPDERVSVGNQIAVTNPLSWTTDVEYVDKKKNKGAVLRKFNKIYPNLVDAQIHEGFLWVNRPKFAWSFLFTKKNYHVADYNFFYVNVQENAVNRTNSFLNP